MVRNWIVFPASKVRIITDKGRELYWKHYRNHQADKGYTDCLLSYVEKLAVFNMVLFPHYVSSAAVVCAWLGYDVAWRGAWKIVAAGDLSEFLLPHVSSRAMFNATWPLQRFSIKSHHPPIYKHITNFVHAFFGSHVRSLWAHWFLLYSLTMQSRDRSPPFAGHLGLGVRLRDHIKTLDIDSSMRQNIPPSIFSQSTFDRIGRHKWQSGVNQTQLSDIRMGNTLKEQIYYLPP